MYLINYSIKYIFINESIALFKFALISFITIEILLSLLTYYIILFSFLSPFFISLSIYYIILVSSLIYIISKNSFIIANLYIRYVLFNRIRLIIDLLKSIPFKIIF